MILNSSVSILARQLFGVGSNMLYSGCVRLSEGISYSHVAVRSAQLCLSVQERTRRQACDGWRQLTDTMKTEIVKSITATEAEFLPATIVASIERFSQHLREMLSLRFVSNDDETKPYLPFNPNRMCNIITIGIGGDISAELKIKSLFPHCVFVGADPGQDVGSLYSQVGTFFSAAISNVTSEKKESLVLNKKRTKYTPEMVRHVSIVDFLVQIAKMNTIDLMLLDAEGAEYDILPLLTRNGSVVRNGLRICQLSIELHDPVIQLPMDLDNWKRTFIQFLLDSDFVPIWATEFYYQKRIFFINTADSICTQKYSPCSVNARVTLMVMNTLRNKLNAFPV